MKKIIKKISFAIIVVALILLTGLIIKTGKFEKLEGYMYSLAMDINSSATDTNATSSDATSSNATSCDATSSNATTSDATSCDATSCDATSSNSTSSNTTTEIVKVTNTQTNTNTPNDANKVDEEYNIEELEEVVEYDNSKITQDMLNKISNSTKTQSIIINVDDNGDIKKEVFDAIKGKQIKLTIKYEENEIIFYGDNIKATKAIDPTVTYNLTNEDNLLKEIVENGVVINFEDNGELPGTAKIRIKVTNDIKEALNMDKILIYYYNQETKELTQLANNAIYNEKEGYIEFSISHNSKYVLVNNLIEEKEYVVTTTEEDNEVTFLESHKMYIIIIGMSILAIIIVTIIIIVDKKAIAKRKAKANNENKID